MKINHIFRTRGELILLVSGTALALIILGIYAWGITRLGTALSASVGGGDEGAATKIEFHVKAAGDLLRARGLIE